MADRERAEALEKAIEYCAICPNMCRFDCPVARAEKTESAAPAGKVRLVRMLAAGTLARTSDLARYLYRCADCRGCEPWCPFPEVKVADIMVAGRAEALASGAVPLPIAAVLAGLRAYGHPFARQLPRRLAPADALGPAAAAHGAIPAADRDASVLFLPGCTAAELRPATSRAIAAVLDAAQVEWQTLAEPLCCGAPARVAGDLALEAELAAGLAAAIDRTGATTVITACPGCAESLGLRYPELGITLGPRVRHFSAFAAEMIAAGRVKLGPPGVSSAVYHDPCTMTRRLELAGQPRTVLGAIPGLELREPPHRGRETHCCGAGGMLAEVWPDASARVTAERLAELTGTGADAIVTTCPMCETVFSLAQEGSPHATPVLDLAELLQRSIAGGDSRA